MTLRRWWRTATAVAAALLIAHQVPGAPANRSGPPAKVRTAALSVGADGASAVLTKRGTPRFSMVGVTWADPTARVTGPVEVRTRDSRSGVWSGWLPLGGDGGRGDGGGRGRGGTEPAWVGPSDGAEVRVSGTRGAGAGLPRGLRLDMIDPGPDRRPEGGGGDGMVPVAFTRDAPDIVSRDSWGADESLSPGAPDYLPGGVVKAVVVHHTAHSDDYTCAQAPAVVRAIHTYHVAQLSWNDIGYNFVIDKCGTVYEGRKGGADQPVLGAHAYGFNSETTGVAVIGDHTDAAPPDAALTAVARVAAWKLARYGVDPTGTTTLTAGADGSNHAHQSWQEGDALTFPAIHGHRDGYPTECPGDAFYDRLPDVRDRAGDDG
ncbi:peptidoglycan recognition protein [Streptomyces sp. NPDC020965]|uniref:peptidoglycan recognition protein n=1 Tax=Streptomyces sp. NPDC020965 TaxID=3365105 RepID=UPI0037BBADB5